MNPPPPPFPPSMPPLPQQGWWQRNWKWSIPVGVVTVISLGLSFVFLIFFSVFRLAKSSEPCKQAVALAAANPEIQAELGTPIEVGFMVSGSISSSNTSGEAMLDIPISGPKGEAHVFVEGKKAAGLWTYSRMEVVLPGTTQPVSLIP
jgi:hypothetical protein